MTANRPASQRIAMTALISIAALGYVLVPPVLFADRTYFLTVAITASVLAIMSLGVWLTFAIGRINIAQGAFALVGGYVAGIGMVDLGIPFWLCLPLAGLISGFAGFLIGWPILRLKGVYFAMLTLSLGEAVRLVALNAESITGGATGITGIPLPGSIELFGWTLVPAFEPGDRIAFYHLAAALLILATLALWQINRSRLGAVFRALRQNESLARSTGIAVPRYRAIAFGIASTFGGIGGAFFATFQQNVYPTTFQVTDSVYLMMYCFIGGLGWLFGPIVGTFSLVIVFEALGGLERYQSLVFAGLLISVMLFMPNGLLALPSYLQRLRAIVFRGRTHMQGGPLPLDRGGPEEAER